MRCLEAHAAPPSLGLQALAPLDEVEARHEELHAPRHVRAVLAEGSPVLLQELFLLFHELFLLLHELGLLLRLLEDRGEELGLPPGCLGPRSHGSMGGLSRGARTKTLQARDPRASLAAEEEKIIM